MSDSYDDAHEVYQYLWEQITALVSQECLPLDADERRYVIDKLHDEYRFWNAEERIAELEASCKS